MSNLKKKKSYQRVKKRKPKEYSTQGPEMSGPQGGGKGRCQAENTQRE